MVLPDSRQRALEGAPDAPTSEALAAAAKAGDRRALELLVERHKDEAFRVALRLCASHPDAEEVLQGALERVLRHLGKYDTGRPFRPWLMRIVVNYARTHWRLRRAKELLFGLDPRDAGPVSAVLPPDGELSRKELRIVLVRAMAMLPRDLREAFVLKHVEGWSYEEIAGHGRFRGHPAGACASGAHDAARALPCLRCNAAAGRRVVRGEARTAMNGIDCERARSLLEDAWDGLDLLAGDAEALGGHLERCETCAHLDADMREVLAGAAELASVRYHRPLLVAPLVVRPRSVARPFALGLLVSATVAALVVALGVRDRSFRPAAAGEVVVHLAVPLPGAASVAVLGDFTGWQKPIPLARDEHGIWVGEVRLKTGRYRYVVLVDGKELVPDPSSPQVVDDGFGGKSSVLDVAGSI